MIIPNLFSAGFIRLIFWFIVFMMPMLVNASKFEPHIEGLMLCDIGSENGKGYFSGVDIGAPDGEQVAFIYNWTPNTAYFGVHVVINGKAIDNWSVFEPQTEKQKKGIELTNEFAHMRIFDTEFLAITIDKTLKLNAHSKTKWHGIVTKVSYRTPAVVSYTLDCTNHSLFDKIQEIIDEANKN